MAQEPTRLNPFSLSGPGDREPFGDFRPRPVAVTKDEQDAPEQSEAEKAARAAHPAAQTGQDEPLVAAVAEKEESPPSEDQEFSDSAQEPAQESVEPSDFLNSDIEELSAQV